MKLVILNTVCSAWISLRAQDQKSGSDCSENPSSISGAN